MAGGVCARLSHTHTWLKNQRLSPHQIRGATILNCGHRLLMPSAHFWLENQ